MDAADLPQKRNGAGRRAVRQPPGLGLRRMVTDSVLFMIVLHLGYADQREPLS